jgi:ABC-type phosphate transport system substrate-binding protein
MKVSFVTLLSLLAMTAGPTAVSSECFEGELTVAGSTTVYSVAVQWGSSYQDTCSASNITVFWELDGSTVGAKRVCAVAPWAPVDIGTMTRNFNEKPFGVFNVTEAAKQDDGYTYNCLQGDTTRVVAQMPAFYDAVAVMVNSNEQSTSDALSVAGCIEKLGCLSADQLRWMFSNYTIDQLTQSGWSSDALPNSDGSDDTHLWSELDSECPAIEIALAGTNYTDSKGQPRADAEFFMKWSYFPGYSSENPERFRSAYFPFDDQNDITTYVLDTPGAIGFASYHIGAKATPNVLLVPLKNPTTGECVSPTAETIQDLSYSPLSRLAYMNVLKSNCTALLKGLDFIEYTYTEAGQKDISDTYGVPLSKEQLDVGGKRIEELRAGCAY